ncbi:MAG TPA: bifunctional oligoribonuclease/PAP phosphatase NrnA [Candidatus Egerieimonas intestinavium]|uniref:Bifunctional oligoribonuclease/PAP phosphatase NrnA n=1 Tax=Candidatus Egerieimonas intestinavium TaxID=2840777 RepID=A0A9D1JFS5_9FIRM|nr:bifunctional oligoribonuclease/PAP phosphatase NrnA [Candidatus Egerieimonas intestinavium]
MNKLLEALKGVGTVAITGHVNPDGDCIGSCMGMYLYLRDNYPQLQVDVYLKDVREVFSYIQGMDQVKENFELGDKYDLLLLFDVSSKDRICVSQEIMNAAKHTVCVDHHVTNSGLGDDNVICPEASSTAEVLFGLLEEEKISKAAAEALYTGIIHDTGMFRHPGTSAETMRIAGVLMDKGIDFSRIVDESFYTRTYRQNQIMGRTILESIMLLDGRCIVGVVSQRVMEFYGVTPKDLDGIVDQLRITRGVEVAIFLYAVGTQQFKVSMRSNGEVNVSEIAQAFGGGGHVQAAGCTMQGSFYDVVNNLTGPIERQLREKKQ